jgi:putative endonuclease
LRGTKQSMSCDKSNIIYIVIDTMKLWYVYIMTNKKYWTLYVGVTSNLLQRVYQHKEWVIEWFTKQYWLKMLVYY